jgi:hypothetical protein
MWIFDRLRGRTRDKVVERKLFKTIAAGLLKEMAEKEPSAVSKSGNNGCCSCCSADAK